MFFFLAVGLRHRCSQGELIQGCRGFLFVGKMKEMNKKVLLCAVIDYPINRVSLGVISCFPAVEQSLKRRRTDQRDGKGDIAM